MLKEKARSFPLDVEPGSYMARCYRIVEIGTIPGEYKGEKSITRKIMFTYELPEEQKVWKEGEAAKPVSISKVFSFYTTSKPPKKTMLREFIEGWIGVGMTELEAKEMDVMDLLGKECVLTIIHKPKTDGSKKLEITGCAKLMKNQVCPPSVNLPRALTYDNFDTAEFATLPQWLQDDMKNSEEYKHMMGTGDGIDREVQHEGVDGPDDDDIKELTAAIAKAKTFNSQPELESYAKGLSKKITSSEVFREAYKATYANCLPF